jgi:hypothetical protein
MEWCVKVMRVKTGFCDLVSEPQNGKEKEGGEGPCSETAYGWLASTGT